MLLPRPATDTPAVRALCGRLVPGAVPDVILITPEPGATPDNCTLNVVAAIERRGGTSQSGWRLWESIPGALLEAEFHMIWIDPGGAQRDITPQVLPGLDRSVFLADPNLVYRGRQIDNVRVPLNPDSRIVALIGLYEERFAILNAGELADQHGQVVLRGEAATKAAANKSRLERLELELRTPSASR